MSKFLYLLGLCLPMICLVACESAESESQGGPDSSSVALDTPQIEAPVAVDTQVRIPEYEQVFLDSGFVDIQEEIPGILIDLKYTTTDNFVNYDLYGDLERCFLHPEAAKKLKKAQEILQEKEPSYSLLVFDGARPHRVQFKMWEELDVPNKRNYLSPPEKGSVHNYGFAVDLTIADSTGTPLDMGTPFDFFGELAQPKLEPKMLADSLLTQEQLDHRLLLRETMQAAGFYPIRTEWWHFNGLGSKTVRSRYNIIP